MPLTDQIFHLSVFDGVRVIYFSRRAAMEIWPLLIYAKSTRASIPGHLLKAIREEIEHG